jgi:G3E family GTPase
MNTLQQLQQSNPSEYQQVTAQIATNLQNAAATDTAQGNTAGASELNQLASDFTQASQSGQLPSSQDLMQALGGHHHHHGHHQADSSSASTSSTDSTTSSTSTTSGSSTSGTSSSSSTNPFEIILSTLAKAGIDLTGSSQSTQL